MIPKLQQDGVKVVLQEKFKSGDTDYTAQANAVKQANPDAMYLCGLPADGGRMLPQLKRAGITSKLLGDTVFGDTVVPKLAGPAADGFYALWINATQFMGENSGPMGEWKGRFAKAFPNPPPSTPNSFSLAGYADFYVFADGLRRAGKDPTQEKMIAGLEQERNFVAGKDGFFKWAVPIGLPRSFKEGDHKGNRECVLIIVKNGEYSRVQNFGGT
jgi:branched-chain amino acid transport system substrate-binding protein